MKTIGAVIKHERERKKISRYMLSKDLGISYPTIVNIENGCDVRVSTLLKVCGALSLNISVSRV